MGFFDKLLAWGVFDKLFALLKPYADRQVADLVLYMQARKWVVEAEYNGKVRQFIGVPVPDDPQYMEGNIKSFLKDLKAGLEYVAQHGTPRG